MEDLHKETGDLRISCAVCRAKVLKEEGKLTDEGMCLCSSCYLSYEVLKEFGELELGVMEEEE